jgi:hypothetical protein
MQPRSYGVSPNPSSRSLATLAGRLQREAEHAAQQIAPMRGSIRREQRALSASLDLLEALRQSLAEGAR